MVMSLSRVLWKVRSKAPTVTASVQGTVSVTGEGYTTIRDSTGFRSPWAEAPSLLPTDAAWAELLAVLPTEP